MKRSKAIRIVGAEEHNLKNIDVEFQRGKITTVTGVSGSGKSSLVFDTLLSESQRRFFYTLSHYARQFLSADEKPKFLRIEGLSPSIGLAQNETLLSRRSSVATESDIGELMGVAFARYGNYLCPTHQLDTTAQSIDSVIKRLIHEQEGKVIAICAQIIEEKRGHYRSELETFAKKGFTKALIDGKVTPLTPIPELDKSRKHSIALIIDYVSLTAAKKKRIQQSIETAIQITPEEFAIVEAKSPQAFELSSWLKISLASGCPQCGYSWTKLDSRHFSPNSLGKCTYCSGLGSAADTGEHDIKDPYQKCPHCQGVGLKQDLESVRLSGISIFDCYQTPIATNLKFWKQLGQKSKSKPALLRLCHEIMAKMAQMGDMGIDYLSLSRRLPTLSGGELQRLKLSSLFSDNLHGLIYVLDEPSQGLHTQEITKLMDKLRQLADMGNTVLIVDHDELVMQMSDQILELGPEGGLKGGQLIAQFPPQAASKWARKSLTARYLHEYMTQGTRTTRSKCPLPKEDADNWICLTELKLNCLKIPRVAFKRHALNVVTGVSGAGKSSLVFGSLLPTLKACKDGQLETFFTTHATIARSISTLPTQTTIDAIDRRPMGRSRLSMPVTYLGAYTAIRELYASLPEAQIMGITAKDLSLLSKGGRCEDCKGRGYIELSMKFLSDAKVTCTSCLGMRFGMMVLQLKYLNKNLNDVLNMTIREAAEVFAKHPSICRKLQPAIDLGLGYLQLGQPVITLSGGEAQRIRLAPYFAKKKDEHAIILMDEPTQGLHSQDVDVLIHNLRNLTAKGITIVVIEHHPALEQAADWILELGPGAGSQGGKLVWQGMNAPTKT
ncbi:MAG: hypothetical protein OXT67_10960 [Zetaproteobacteria bacterium]|nr:hypothetical protein [Zetaproteobacteria bacterium]